MKKLFLASMMVVSAFAVADDSDITLKVGRHANPVRIDSVSTEAVGEQGFPSTRVLVRATFGNKCTVPRANELVTIAQHTNHYENLVLTLGSEVRRMCPMHYMPVTVTIELGTYTKPNDGLFREITVNGKAAN